LLEGRVAAYRPRAHDVRLADDLVQLLVAYAIVVQRPPAARYAHEHRVPPVAPIVLEELDELRTLREGVLAAVVEADAPHGDHGLPCVPQAGSVLVTPAELHPAPQDLPARNDVPDAARRQPRQVVHDGVTAAPAVGPLPAVDQDLVAMMQVGRLNGLDAEPLD